MCFYLLDQQDDINVAGAVTHKVDISIQLTSPPESTFHASAAHGSSGHQVAW